MVILFTLSLPKFHIRLRMTKLLVVHRVLLVAVVAVLAHLAVVRLAGIVSQALRGLLRLDRHD